MPKSKRTCEHAASVVSGGAMTRNEAREMQSVPCAALTAEGRKALAGLTLEMSKQHAMYEAALNTGRADLAANCLRRIDTVNDCIAMLFHR